MNEWQRVLILKRELSRLFHDGKMFINDHLYNEILKWYCDEYVGFFRLFQLNYNAYEQKKMNF